VAARKAKKRTSSKTKAPSNGLLTHGGIAALIGIIGLVAAFAVIWWQLILEPQAAKQRVEHERLLTEYAQFINSRITDLRAIVGAMATAPATIEALTSFNATRRDAIERIMVDQTPHVVRVEIFERGKAEIDLNAEVPISFAALDLIRRAESREFVGPEVGPNQRRLIYAAQPITNEGAVGGVLLVVFEPSFMLNPLQHFTKLRGKLEVLQTVENTPTTSVLTVNESAGELAALEKQLFVPHWKISFAPKKSEVNGANYTSSLFGPFALAATFLLGGIFLGLSNFRRNLNSDAETLTEYATRLVRGRSAAMGRYHLATMQQVASSLAAYGEGNAPEVAADSEPASEDDLLADIVEEPKPAPKTPPKKGNNSDEFLDVRSSATQDNFGIEVSEEVGPLDMDINWDPGIFRAYDIRGITTSNLTEDVVYWIGRAFAAEALAKNRSRVVVGRDGRHSGLPLQESLTKGLTEGGMDVVSIGQVPTPVLYYATHALDTGTGIMITGSHNPPEYNGLKMMIGGVTLAEDMIQALYQRLADNNLSEGNGDVEEIDLDDSYIDKVLEDVAVAQPLKVVVDCGNGVAGELAPRLLRELGCEVTELYCEIDGDFPNHHPDPAEPKNLEDLQTVVQAEHADLGLAFDGDGDRVGVVTNSGQIIWPDKLIMLFAQDIVSRNPGADIIYDVKCSRHLNNIISELGGRPIMWKTGHSHMKAKLKETGALLAGEFSGHICFGERWYGFDDALYSAVRLLEILSSESRTADEVFEQFPVTCTTPEIKITTTESEKFEIMDNLSQQADFGDGTLTTIDGIRVDYADGWGLIRPSNTSPVLTLRFEADNEEALERIQDVFQAQLSAIAPNLSFR
jgi:phosphomannomutase / phosphoglucomutase